MSAPTLPTRPYQMLPPLDEQQRHVLRQSIESCGVLEPVVFDEDGEILDGHHRVEIAEELGIEYPRRVITDLDRPGKWMYAVTVNVARRHLDQSTRSGLVAQMRLRNMSIREIAKATGLPKSTVSDDLRRLSEAGQLEQPERITGADGRDRPATRPTSPGPSGAAQSPPAGSGSTPAPAAESPVLAPPQEPASSPEPADVASTAPAGPGSGVAAAPREGGAAATPPPGSPATWTDEQVEANRREVERKAAIAAAERFAESLVLEVRGMVTTIIDGIDFGAPCQLVTAEMIAECRSALDRLEARVAA